MSPDVARSCLTYAQTNYQQDVEETCLMRRTPSGGRQVGHTSICHFLWSFPFGWTLGQGVNILSHFILKLSGAATESSSMVYYIAVLSSCTFPPPERLLGYRSRRRTSRRVSRGSSETWKLRVYLSLCVSPTEYCATWSLGSIRFH